MKKDENEIVKRYMPLIKKEVKAFASLDITEDELISEAYYIMARAIRQGRHNSETFPAYIKKTLKLGLLRYILRERKRRWELGPGKDA